MTLSLFLCAVIGIEWWAIGQEMITTLKIFEIFGMFDSEANSIFLIILRKTEKGILRAWTLILSEKFTWLYNFIILTISSVFFNCTCRYLMLASVVGFFSLPFFHRLTPILHDTPMTTIIAIGAVILIMSSALPVLSRTLGNWLITCMFSWKVTTYFVAWA